jgi:hypothetical protein
MSLRSLLALGAVASVAACESEAPAGSVELLDSAGVAVVLNAPPAPAIPAFHLSEQPIVVIGDPEGGPEHELFRVAGAALLQNGSVVLANAGTHELRYFDLSGAHLGSAGRQGEGPGEFMSLSLVGPFAGDSLLVWDLSQRRFSVFGPKGPFVRSFQAPEGFGPGAVPVGALTDGRPVVMRRELAVGDPSAVTGVERRPSSIFILGREGGIETEIGPFPGPETSVVIGEFGPSVFGVVLGRSLHATAQGDRIAAGNDDAYSIRTYQANGDLTGIVRQTREPVPVASGDFERALPEVLRPDSPPSPAKERVQANIDQMPRHPTFPAFGSGSPRVLRFDRSGNLWVREYQPPWDESASWQVFDASGAMLGRLDFPDGVELLDIGPDWVLTRARDELDVERVVLYGLEAPSGAARSIADTR